MYPKGSRWADSTEIMYVNVVQSEEGESLSAFIQGDLARQRVNSPDLVDEAAEPIALVGGARAEVRHLRGDAWGNHEAVAYVAQGRGVAIFVLSCRSENGFRRSLAAFRAMVKNSFLAAMEFKE